VNPAEGAYRQALELHKDGQLAEALAQYEQVLKLQPNHANTLHQMGVIALQTRRPEAAVELIGRSIRLNSSSVVAHINRGRAEYELHRFDAALASFEQAIRLKPDHAEGHNNRGIALAALRRYPEALASYDRAILLDPNCADAHSNRGIVLGNLGRNEEALTGFDRAIGLNPGHALAFNNRAVVLGNLGRDEEALASYDRAITLATDYADAHNNRGVILRALERFDEAVASCDKAIAIRPNYADAHSNRGVALREMGCHDAALASFDRAIALDSRHAMALNDRGITLAELRRYEEALASYDRALRLSPGSAEIYNNCGYLLGELKRTDRALASYDKAIALAPRNAEAHVNRGVLLTSIKRYEMGLASFDRALELKPDFSFLRGMRLHNRLHICDWRDFDAEGAVIAAAVERDQQVSNPLSFLALCGSARLQRRVADVWARMEHAHNPSLPPLPARAAGGASHAEVTEHAGDKIRVGYFSPDFRAHAVSVLTARLFEIHDRSRFEWIAFSFGPDTRDPIRIRMEKAFDRFIDVRGRSDADIARLARSVGIDIAVDLGGYTQGCRTGIFVRRAAPVQVGFLGYPGTLGGHILDYLVADPIVVPEGSRGHYSECIIELPHSYLPSDSQRPISTRVFAREELGLPASGFVYCCFNNSYKITPDVFDSWMRILTRVGNSVLWLSDGHAKATENLRREARARGLDPARLIFAQRLPSLEEHLARLRAADLFLDTAPYNAHTTASDALWAGVPVLTRPGDGFAARVGASLLSAIELPDLIASDPKSYEALAVELAHAPGKLAEIKAKLARNRLTTPLFDTNRFARNLESAFRAIHERYQAGLPAEHIRVPP